MSTLTSWYRHQYATWDRTRRLRVSPFLARTDTNLSRTATALAQGGAQDAVIINMGDLGGNGSPDANKKEKKQDSLFGPNIGVVSAGPKWTEGNEKKVLEDQLTPDVVKGWIAKSKEPSQPTTTLQALVNLKRPTLRLSPLASLSADDATQIDSQHHGLEFEYDCDAPKCGLYVHVLVHPAHLSEGSSTDKSSKILVFESVLDGGFGKLLTLEEGATLELGKFESKSEADTPGTNAPAGISDASADAALPESSPPDDAQPRDRKSRRFTAFHFRKAFQGRHVSGPALAVVDAEPSSPVTSENKKSDEDDDNDGVKVIIRLVALDKEGAEVGNEQMTYLHVVRFGEKVIGDSEKGTEDKRPWVVKVVKREATIGPHTFHLHEIYGLSSHSTTATAPQPATTSQTASPTSNAYPPSATAPIPNITEDASSASECLLCLSSPREVVLLPCRHLVACKDCALNMVEYGAGGTITQAVEESAPVGDAATADSPPNPAEGSAAVPGAVTATPPTATTRRKRKAKGWFCPVCRQPYTSLLRLTTTPPESAPVGDGKDLESESHDPISSDVDAVTAVPPVRGLGTFRPGFLRSWSRGGNTAYSERDNASTNATTPTAPFPADVERGLRAST